jgi:undecaprenyl-diphosphatase
MTNFWRRDWARMKRAPALSFHNATKPIEIVLGRLSRRAALYPELGWERWALACVALALASFFLLDPVTGHLLNKWPPALVEIAQSTTKIGLGKWYIVPPVVWLVFANLVDWRALSRRMLMQFYNWTSLAFLLLGSAGLSGLTVLFLKSIIGRARPLNFEKMGDFAFHPLTFNPHFASFPSGHATTIGAVTALLILLWPRWKYLFVPLAVWVASTRVFVGAHYPSDTIIGFGLGFGYSIGLALLFARLGFVFLQQPASLPIRKSTFVLLPARRAKSRRLSLTSTSKGKLAEMP